MEEKDLKESGLVDLEAPQPLPDGWAVLGQRKTKAGTYTIICLAPNGIEVSLFLDKCSFILNEKTGKCDKLITPVWYLSKQYAYALARANK